MSYIVEFLVLNLLVFNDYRSVEGFNETCTSDQSCSQSMKCVNGYCLCSQLGTTTNEKDPLAFWSGYQCITCPLHFTTTGTKCYQLTLEHKNRVNWDRARQRCQEHGSDLLLFRTRDEFNLIAGVIRARLHDGEMEDRTPKAGAKFGSIWIGARLVDWAGEGRYDLVSHGPALTKRNPDWCPASSPLEQEPNYVEIKDSGVRQECIGVAIFKDKMVCLHDWFCSYATHTLCEVHPPPPPTTIAPPSDITPDALAAPSSNLLYIGIGGAVFVMLLFISIGAYCCICRKTKSSGRGRSFDSADSGMSQNSVY